MLSDYRKPASGDLRVPRVHGALPLIRQAVRVHMPAYSSVENDADTAISITLQWTS